MSLEGDLAAARETAAAIQALNDAAWAHRLELEAALARVCAARDRAEAQLAAIAKIATQALVMDPVTRNAVLALSRGVPRRECERLLKRYGRGPGKEKR